MKCCNCRNLCRMIGEDGEPYPWCEKVCDAPDPNAERDCRHYVTAKRIEQLQNMSAVEFAVWLEEFSYNVTTCPKDKCHLASLYIGEPLDREECKRCWLNWLLEEIKT